MPIVGSPTYQPQGQFAFPRTYVKQLTFGFASNALVVNTNEDFYVTDLTSGIIHVVANFAPEFWAASSNRYTLDFILEDWWLIVDPSTIPQPLNFFMKFQVDPVTGANEIFIYLTGWTTRYTTPLPSYNEEYWTPL